MTRKTRELTPEQKLRASVQLVRTSVYCEVKRMYDICQKAEELNVMQLDELRAVYAKLFEAGWIIDHVLGLAKDV